MRTSRREYYYGNSYKVSFWLSLYSLKSLAFCSALQLLRLRMMLSLEMISILHWEMASSFSLRSCSMRMRLSDIFFCFDFDSSAVVCLYLGEACL